MMDRAARVLDEAAANSEPEPGPLADVFRRNERFEEPTRDTRIDSRAVVFDLDSNATRDHLRADDNLTARLRSGVRGVEDEV